MTNDTDTLKGQIAALQAAVDALIETHHSGQTLHSKFRAETLKTLPVLERTGESPVVLDAFVTTALKIAETIRRKMQRCGVLPVGKHHRKVP